MYVPEFLSDNSCNTVPSSRKGFFSEHYFFHTPVFSSFSQKSKNMKRYRKKGNKSSKYTESRQQEVFCPQGKCMVSLPANWWDYITISLVKKHIYKILPPLGMNGRSKYNAVKQQSRIQDIVVYVRFGFLANDCLSFLQCIYFLAQSNINCHCRSTIEITRWGRWSRWGSWGQVGQCLDKQQGGMGPVEEVGVGHTRSRPRLAEPRHTTSRHLDDPFAAQSEHETSLQLVMQHYDLSATMNQLTELGALIAMVGGKSAFLATLRELQTTIA